MDRRSARTALALALVSLPVATWWVVGDVSEPDGSDYMFRAPSVLENYEHVIGASASLVFLPSSVIALSSAGRRALGRTDLRSALPLAAAGVYGGFAYRVMTAAVGGANIGGAFMFMFAVAFIPAMAVVALVQFRRGR